MSKAYCRINNINNLLSSNVIKLYKYIYILCKPTKCGGTFVFQEPISKLINRIMSFLYAKGLFSTQPPLRGEGELCQIFTMFLADVHGLKKYYSHLRLDCKLRLLWYICVSCRLLVAWWCYSSWCHWWCSRLITGWTWCCPHWNTQYTVWSDWRLYDLWSCASSE